MSPLPAALTDRLEAQARRLAGRPLLDLFAADPGRARRFAVEAAGLYLDFSKQPLDSEALALLLEAADAAGVPARRDAMFAGEPINRTEQRAVLHTALRNPDDPGPTVDGEPVGPAIREVRTRMREVVTAVTEGRWTGHSGAPIRDVVNLGIGGSHLGPQLACDALRHAHTRRLRVHFVSNVDGGEIERHLRGLDPATTLFIVASKSFTTPETALNARTAQRWLLDRFGDRAAIAAHFFAITAHPDRAEAFGIAPRNVLPMWDWVGGRYSLWSAIGLPVAFAVGMDAFEQLLEGAAAMDRHFREAPLAVNMPVLLALVGWWNTSLLGMESLAVVPYDDRLQHLPAYLQQLEMESNGKRITNGNEPVKGHTAPILWGGLGTNVQHAFFQLLHQGTRRIPLDFVIALSHPTSPPGHHDMLVANCLAQAEGLMGGRSPESLADGPPAAPGVDLPLHRATPGNQPSNLLCCTALTPGTFGALLALYEHKTFVQGCLWDIDSFDQWGVELGKQLASRLLGEIEGGPREAHDGSTTALLERYLAVRDAGLKRG